MKRSAILFFTLLVGALGYTWDPEELECVNELKLDKEQIEKLNDPWDKPTPTDNKELNDFLECSWKKEKTLDESGKIVWEKVTDILQEAVKAHIKEDPSLESVVGSTITGGVIMGAIEECQEKNIQGSSPGETVAKNQNCFGEVLRRIIEEAKDRK